ncbi:hypothetical protein OFP91_00740 [Brachyspira hyodysenteriae]|uniref:hypothetical protein n=2 Tax=Brachyspira hyodysenteriae TaxID=159 RepID=UPI0022CD6534|nr:hypothetical protein [Brachyspira hyodysenteriae]MCZ9896557.1 hypothetical protein [Brachyspira hyodysenteriae]
MIKKVLLIAAFIIFAVSCSKTPTNPNNGNTGDSGIINGGSGTTEPTAISDFLKNHSGRYYYQYDDGSFYVREKIENGKIYDMSSSEEDVEITGNMILLDNKLQIETVKYYEPLNKVIYLYTFNNNGISKSTKNIYEKEPVSSTTGYKQLAKVNGLEKYAGAYYNYYYKSSGGLPPQPEKNINIIIDNNGYIYAQISEQIQIQINNITLNGDTLVIKMSQVVPRENGQSYTYNVEQSMIFKNNYAIDNNIKVNGEYQGLDEYNKSDLLTSYIGDYNSTDGSGITLMVKSNKPTLIINSIVYSDGILLGNTLTISAYISSNNYKKYVIVFSDDKKTATYTDPDTQKVTLTKQGA